MKIIITEEQFNKFNKSSPALQNGIYKYLNHYISEGSRKITPKSRSYGNFHEEWCIGGKEVISVYYYFEKGKFNQGTLSVSNNLVNVITNLYSIKKSYALHVIEEWYDDTMVPKFERIVGESGLSISSINVSYFDHDCVPEPVKPEGITDKEMIDFIVKKTLYTEPDVIEKIESGERNLDDFYLDILNVVNRKEITGF